MTTKKAPGTPSYVDKTVGTDKSKGKLDPGDQAPPSSLSSLTLPKPPGLSSTPSGAHPAPTPADFKGDATLEARLEAKMEAMFMSLQEKLLFAQLPAPGSGAKAKKGKKPSGGKDMLADIGTSVGFTPKKSKAESKKPVTPDGSDTDTDDDSDGKTPEKKTSAVPKQRERAAALMVQDIVENHVSFTGWVRQNDWRSGRNRHEAEVWAYVIDQMLKDGGHHIETDYFEAAVRRLTGIQKVDSGTKWSVARALEWHPTKDVLPRHILKEALKEAQLTEKFDNDVGGGGGKGKSGGGGDSYYNGGGGGGGGYGKKKSHNKRRSGGASSGQGSTGGASDGAQKK